jgi:hypothetical protein
MGKFWQILFCAACCLVTTKLMAQGKGDIATLTTHFDFGPSTYKSALLESNDTSYTMRYGGTVLAGETKSLEFAIFRDSNTTAFLLNEASMASSWQDTHLRYRWAYGYCGFVLSSASLVAQSAGETEVFDITASGYGVSFGFNMPFAKRGMVALDAAYVVPTKLVEVNQVDVSIGSRMDLDMNISYGLTRQFLSLILGYRTRSLGITLNEAFAEGISTTYLGLSGSFFL